MKTAPFNIGDKIVCLTSGGRYHKKGNEYTVAEIFQCDSCSIWHVMTSETHDPPASKYICDCFSRLQDTAFYGGNVKHFALVQPRHADVSIECNIDEMYLATKETIESPKTPANVTE